MTRDTLLTQFFVTAVTNGGFFPDAGAAAIYVIGKKKAPPERGCEAFTIGCNDFALSGERFHELAELRFPE